MKCPKCGTDNAPNAVFCSQCGASLSRVASGSGDTAPVKPSQQPVPPVPQSFPPPPEQLGIPLTPCKLLIGGKRITVPLKQEVILGRADIKTNWKPEVDLTPFGGTSDAGVSRKHVKILWQGKWMLEDLNSTNGTFVRGQRVSAGQRVPINHDETFQVGKLQIKFLAQ